MKIPPLRQINQEHVHGQQAQEREMDGDEETGIDARFED